MQRRQFLHNQDRWRADLGAGAKQGENLRSGTSLAALTLEAANALFAPFRTHDVFD